MSEHFGEQGQPLDTGHEDGEEVWDDPELRPPPTWNGTKAVYAHVTHSILGEHFDEGEDIVVMFRDRALVCSVDEVVTDDDE